MEKVCPVCEIKYESKNIRQVCCSRQCAKVKCYRTEINYPISNILFNSIVIKCKICNEEFKAKRNSKYCSYNCSNRYNVLIKKKLPLDTPKRKQNRNKQYIPILNQYLCVWIHNKAYPACSYKRKTYLVHRLVAKLMMQEKGEELTSNHTVHHIDKDKMNFHPDNLQIIIGRHGSKDGIIDEIDLYIKRLDELGYEVIKKAA